MACQRDRSRLVLPMALSHLFVERCGVLTGHEHGEVAVESARYFLKCFGKLELAGLGSPLRVHQEQLRELVGLAGADEPLEQIRCGVLTRPCSKP